MTTDLRCGATWYGHRTEHCTECHQTFAGTKAGDAHRVGPFTPPGARRCRGAEEMTAGGMWSTVNPYGTPVWHGEFSTKGTVRRWSGPEKEER